MNGQINNIVFFDFELDTEETKIVDIGAVRGNSRFHSSSVKDFLTFIKGAHFLCGHNIIQHDAPLFEQITGRTFNQPLIDTLYLSVLLFPGKQIHKLLKDDKLIVEEKNNPLNDSIKARNLFFEELNEYAALPVDLQKIYSGILHNRQEFKGFFDYQAMPYYPIEITVSSIKHFFENDICQNSQISLFAKRLPIELSYVLSVIHNIKVSTADYAFPAWVSYQYPKVHNMIRSLRSTPCKENCPYCKRLLDPYVNLKKYFGYTNFREYDGEPLQEKAVTAAIRGESLIAVFPTGGGKSLTFQLPAFIAGSTSKGLTIIISPLQSLMKDQVDNLAKRGLTNAVTINGLLTPLERKNAITRIKNGSANLLYIAPEQLRSRSIERLIRQRNVVRFVIDEAHCFSSWGQDFRVDYMYIGDFIKKLQSVRKDKYPIPVSCFTATAKQQVINDIQNYFYEKLGLNLQVFSASAKRVNLSYQVIFVEESRNKYEEIRRLIEAHPGYPTIIYTSSVKRTLDLAARLTADGYPALPYNGQMESQEKIENQEKFIRNEVQIIVATSAFGMGVDKSDVRMVIHYDIADSLESYVQEAGRAGRDPTITAECYILFQENDLDKHFVLHNQTKITANEIKQIWKAVRAFTEEKHSSHFRASTREIARQAGWDTEGTDIDTRVKTALMALETSGFLRRGNNSSQIYANAIKANSMQEISDTLHTTSVFKSEGQRQTAILVMQSLFGSEYRSKAKNAADYKAVDELADIIGCTKAEVIDAITTLRLLEILNDDFDMSTQVPGKIQASRRKAEKNLNHFLKLEQFILSQIEANNYHISDKEMNEKAIRSGITDSSEADIKTLKHFYMITSCLIQPDSEDGHVSNGFYEAKPIDELKIRYEKRAEITIHILNHLYQELESGSTAFNPETGTMRFSVVSLYNSFQNEPNFLNIYNSSLTLSDIEDALLYISIAKIAPIEGGFLVLYNTIELERLESDNRKPYTVEKDYAKLNKFYEMRVQQVHIVGEFASLLKKDKDTALEFMSDYFSMDYDEFLKKYFKGRLTAIRRPMSPGRYQKLFGVLSPKQKEIIDDNKSNYIVVAAGPGSGKTKILVHKLASLLQMENVKHEQLLMLTFSRAAATEFKSRFIELFGNAATYVDIKTFHSYSFDLLGRIGSLQDSEDIVRRASEMILTGEVEAERVTKSVLVIDEAQDMDADEYNLIRSLIKVNGKDLRIIAVGDDDQSIFEFRGASPDYFKSLLEEDNSIKYELTENYRSKANIVRLANDFVTNIRSRMKSEPIYPKRKDNGIVEIYEHTMGNLITAISADVYSTYHSGTACVLTNTNMEALQVMGQLLHDGIRAKLIQSTKGFKLSNLAEIRFFLDELKKDLVTPTINSDKWKNAKDALSEKFKRSLCLKNCLNLIRSFEETNAELYFSDLQEFIYMSSFEDYYFDEKGTVFVSTIHKSKGREFDSVFMLLDHVPMENDSDFRKIYVGLTRAKEALRIHCNTDFFRKYDVGYLDYYVDDMDYGIPEEIMMQLSLDDVYLDFAINRQNFITNLRSGQELFLDGKKIYVDNGGKKLYVAQLSQKCYSEIERLKTSGYSPLMAEVGFVVAWSKTTDDGEKKEYYECLPNIYLVKDG